MDTSHSLPTNIPVPHLESDFTASESDFYSRYSWCLNPFLPIHQVVGHLRTEVDHLSIAEEAWQIEEIMTNIFLLSCAISDSADDCLSGKRVDLSRFKRVSRLTAPLFSVPEAILNAKQRRAQSRLDGLRKWRVEWEEALHQLLRTCVHHGRVDMAAYAEAARNLVSLLQGELPVEFTLRQIKSPRAFRSQDFTFEDIVCLAEKFCAEFPDHGKPYLVVGPRTAGSYFAPILRAYMANQGYADTGVITLRPKSGASPTETALLRQYAGRGGIAVIIDEPVYQGVTLGICIRLLKGAGFTASSIVALFPVHPAARDWQHTPASIAVHGCRVVTTQPEETIKYKLLQPGSIEGLLRPYFAERGWESALIADDATARKLNDHLSKTSDEAFHTRLKRVFAFRLWKPSGEREIHHVIAKSVGCGWTGYQTFFAAQKLKRFVPPALGLRNGILFSEWVGSGPLEAETCNRQQVVESLAQYVAARSEGLRFPEDPSPALCKAGLQIGMDVLVETLSGLYRSNLVARLRRHGLREQLSQLSAPTASLLDAKMRPSEWVRTDAGILKTDFEQHGMGRMDLSVTDPAYDLADSALSFGLSHEEEKALLDRYQELTGDAGIASRLPLYKLLASQWQMGASLYCLGDPKLTARYAEFSRSYIDGWTFATVQMARFCGAFLPKPATRQDSGKLIFADVDGVIDQHTFQFPTTTQSGIRALSLLTSHGFPVFLNTARSRHDVKEYCAAYGLPGGVAESGSVLWDAVAGREQVLVDSQSLAELDRVRVLLEQLPGVFTNHFYRYSIKAFTFVQGGTVPLPTPLVNRVLAQVSATTLAVHETSSDTAITCRDVDKGTGLTAMLEFIGREGAETIAIGDTAPDLAMFRVASRCYAPSHTPVRDLAMLLGCHVAGGSYQVGLLEIARDIVHRDGETCPACVEPQFTCEGQARLIIDLLGEVEKSKAKRILEALRDVRSMSALLG